MNFTNDREALKKEFLQAVIETNRKIVLEFLKHDASLATAPLLYGKTALLIAVSNSWKWKPPTPDFKNMVKDLLKYGADIHARDSSGCSVLHHTSDVATVTFLLARRADINARNLKGYTPLHLALKGGNKQLVALLLKKKAKLFLSDENKFDLHRAVGFGNNHYVQILLQYGVDANVQDDRGCLPLHHVRLYRDFLEPEVVRLLITRTTNISVRDKTGRTPLDEAVEMRDSKFVQLLLQNNGQINAQDKNGETVLHLVARNYHPPLSGALKCVPKPCDVHDITKNWLTFEVLVQHHSVDVNLRNNQGNTPLLDLVSDGYAYNTEKKLTMLLNRGADVNVANYVGVTPLHLASKRSNLAAVKLLLAHQADVNARDVNGVTPLHLALCANFDKVRENRYAPKDERRNLENNVRIVRLLIDHHADVNATTELFDSPLHLTDDFDTIKILLERPLNVNAINKEGRTPLQNAIEGENPLLVKLLLEHGAIIDVQDEEGRTPLHNAVDADDADLLVKPLLDHGPNFNLQDKDGATPLHNAVEIEDSALVKLLLDHGSDVTIQDKEGRTPLLLATHPEIAMILLDHGSNVNIQDNEGMTPLMNAIESMDLDLVKLVLEYQPVVDIEDHEGNAALHLTVVHTDEEMLQLLLAHDPDVDCQNHDGETPLHLACSEHFLGMMRLLLDSGADVDLVDKVGNTALHEVLLYATIDWDFQKQCHKLACVKLLLERGADTTIRNYKGDTPLALAFQTRQLDLIYQVIRSSLHCLRSPLERTTRSHLKRSAISGSMEEPNSARRRKVYHL